MKKLVLLKHNIQRALSSLSVSPRLLWPINLIKMNNFRDNKSSYVYILIFSLKWWLSDFILKIFNFYNQCRKPNSESFPYLSHTILRFIIKWMFIPNKYLHKKIYSTLNLGSIYKIYISRKLSGLLDGRVSAGGRFPIL